MLSGDRHAAGIYKAEHKGETMWELTSSSLNLAFGNDNDRSTAREPDPARTTKFFSVENYGLVDIDWKAKALTMTLKGNTSATLGGADALRPGDAFRGNVSRETFSPCWIGAKMA
jgi:alkaline phosphatase D